MRCRSCDLTEARYIEAWEDYYCQDCLDSIFDTLDEYDDVLDDYVYLDRGYYD